MRNTHTKLQKIRNASLAEKPWHPYSEKGLKMDIMAKITAAHQTGVYLRDVEAEVQGHEVVRLPVAHCELNPIELPWANV